MLHGLKADLLDGETETATLIDQIDADWPQATKAISRLADFLGAAGEGEGCEITGPIAVAALERALGAYQAVLDEEDPVRLAALVETLLHVATAELAQVEIVDALGRVWNPADGLALADWRTDAEMPLVARRRGEAGPTEPIYDALAAITMDERTRWVVEDCREAGALSALPAAAGLQ